MCAVFLVSLCHCFIRELWVWKPEVFVLWCVFRAPSSSQLFLKVVPDTHPHVVRLPRVFDEVATGLGERVNAEVIADVPRTREFRESAA